MNTIYLFSTSRSNYCTSLFQRRGAGGNTPFSGGPLDPGLEFGPSEGGAGRMGRFMTFWLELLDVRAG